MSKKALNLFMLVACLMFLHISKARAAEFSQLTQAQQDGVCLQFFEIKSQQKLESLFQQQDSPSDSQVVRQMQVVQVFGYFRQLFIEQHVPQDDQILAQLWYNSQQSHSSDFDPICTAKAKSLNEALSGETRKEYHSQAKSWINTLLDVIEATLQQETDQDRSNSLPDKL